MAVAKICWPTITGRPVTAKGASSVHRRWLVHWSLSIVIDFWVWNHSMINELIQLGPGCCLAVDPACGILGRPEMSHSQNWLCRSILIKSTAEMQFEFDFSMSCGWTCTSWRTVWLLVWTHGGIWFAQSFNLIFILMNAMNPESESSCKAKLGPQKVIGSAVNESRAASKTVTGQF